MNRRLLARSLPPAGAAAVAALLVWSSEVQAFTTLGHSLGLDQRDVRVFNNFADPEANDNTTPHPSWPGAVGAPLAVWKAVAEWGSGLHGDGEGDPSQPGDVGSGGAAYDPTWQGLATGVGTLTGNVVSALSSCGGGVTAVTEWGSSGWRIRLCEDLLWDDGPGVTLSPGAIDIQGVVAHEFGHVLGLGHSNVGGSTMFPALSGNGVAARSIEADDAAGLQFVYGAAARTKPRIDLALSSGSTLALVGEHFAPAGNEVWLTTAGPNASGDPLKVTGLVATLGGTLIELTTPPGVGPGDVLVRVPGAGGNSLSNAFPVDPTSCSEPQAYCTAKTASNGCVAAIASSGVPSASAGSGFLITAADVPSSVNGLLFYGTTGPAAAPFQGGFLCVATPVTRTQVQSSGGSVPPLADCTGTFALDLNAWIVTAGDPALVAGAQVWAQHWYRDPGFAPPESSALSDALAFAVCP